MTETCKTEGKIEEVEKLLRENLSDKGILESRLKELKRELRETDHANQIISSLKTRLRDIKLEARWTNDKTLGFSFSPVSHDILHSEDVHTIDRLGYVIDVLGHDYLWVVRKTN